jgi:hypothetical protein
MWNEMQVRISVATQNHPIAWSHIGPRMGRHTHKNDQKPNEE